MQRIPQRMRAWACAGGAAVLCSGYASWACAADEAYAEDAVQAAYLYRFAGYVEWPEESLAGRPFVIAVSNAHGVAQELRRLLPAHLIHGEIAQVREVARVEDLGNAQMLYVGAGHSELLRAFVALGKRSVLLVTADNEGLESGSMLNFVTVDKRVRFEVSLSAAERMGLRISSELLSVAIRVHGGRTQSDYFCVPFALPDEGDAPCGMRQSRHARRQVWWENLHLTASGAPVGPIMSNKFTG